MNGGSQRLAFHAQTGRGGAGIGDQGEFGGLTVQKLMPIPVGHDDGGGQFFTGDQIFQVSRGAGSALLQADDLRGSQQIVSAAVELTVILVQEPDRQACVCSTAAKCSRGKAE